MKKLNIYLNFPGNTEEAFNFYKMVFGGEFSMFTRFKEVEDLPNKDKMSSEDLEKIMHISLMLGSDTLMGSDSVPGLGNELRQGNNFYISVTAESKEEAGNFFSKLSEGGKVEMPMADAFWSAYFGMAEDKFGVHWMISYDYPK